jgi:D-glycero-alpha-D-manno-heptose 1-phosphate guanylyltransferase
VSETIGAHEAIILVGGLGTRLRPVISNIPKPMAPVSGRPFLAYLLDQLRDYGVERVVLATGYRHEMIKSRFRSGGDGLSISYAVETTPLGTGGGIRLALAHCTGEQVLVLNGDTFFDVDLYEMFAYHRRCRADITIALKELACFDRYGTVTRDCDRVVAFEEKRPCVRGEINGGIYIMRRTLFDGAELPAVFSFETDFLGKRLAQLYVAGFRSDGYFIDIGIPEDYERAGRESARLVPASRGHL